MKKELQDKLYKKYPKIFRQRSLPMQETCMCWGLECGDGWYSLIDQLCHKLQFDTDKNGHNQVEASQVKEKFGGLRFYTNGGDAYQDGAIDFAEYLSHTICEVCGHPGESNGNGWISTLCDKCRREQ